MTSDGSEVSFCLKDWTLPRAFAQNDHAGGGFVETHRGRKSEGVFSCRISLSQTRPSVIEQQAVFSQHLFIIFFPFLAAQPSSHTRTPISDLGVPPAEVAGGTHTPWMCPPHHTQGLRPLHASWPCLLLVLHLGVEVSSGEGDLHSRAFHIAPSLQFGARGQPPA